MRQLHAIWLLVTTGITALVDVGNMIIDGAKIKFRSAPGPAGVRTLLDDSDIVGNLAGNESNKVPSAAAVKTAVDGVALTVNPNSASYLSIQAGQIEVRPLLVTRPIIDKVSTSLASALAARTPAYTLANVTSLNADLQAGDSLILPLHTGGLRVFMHNGGVLGTIEDFTLVEQPALDAVTVRALLTADNGINYNNVTGQFGLGGRLSQNTRIDIENRQFELVSTTLGRAYFSMIAGTSGLVRLEHGAGFLVISENNFNLKLGNNNLASDANIEDGRTVKRGLEYSANYSTGFTARSLVDKGFVDAQILANSLGKANPVVNTTAGVWTTVPHNFALTAGNFDNLIVTMFDSTGVGVTAPFRVKDANNIEVLTAEAVTGLKVRMLKTL